MPEQAADMIVHVPDQPQLAKRLQEAEQELQKNYQLILRLRTNNNSEDEDVQE